MRYGSMLLGLVLASLFGCASPRAMEDHDRYAHSPWAVGNYEIAAGGGRGATHDTQWRNWWMTPSAYLLRVGTWRVGPTVRLFGARGKTDASFDFRQEVVAGGIAIKHTTPTRQSIIRFIGGKENDSGYNSEREYFTEDRTTIFGPSLSFTRWFHEGVVREVDYWFEGKFGLQQEKKSSQNGVALSAANDPKEHRSEMRVGLLFDFLQSANKNFTFGAGSEFVVKEKNKKTVAPLLRIRLWKHLYLVFSRNVNHHDQDTTVFSANIVLWGTPE